MNREIREVPLDAVWQMRQEVMYPELTIEAVKLDDDATGIHLGLYHNGELCSVVSLFQNGGDLQFRKFATRTALQGRGFGTELLQYVFEHARANGTKRIWCNARTSASAFYKKFGMAPFGETWEDLGHRFVKMQIEL